MDVILTHEIADFDAVASLLGAHRLYPSAKPILPHRINRNVQAFLTLYGTSLPFLDADALPRGQRIRRVLLVDTQKLGSIRGLGREVEEVLVIDHHTRSEALPEHWSFQGEPVGANVTLLVEGLSTRLVPISPVEATLLLAGIYEDTGTLTYQTTTARDLRAAGWLLEQGASLPIASKFLEHPLTPAQQLIYDDLQAHAQTLELNGHPVVISWAESPPGSEEEISALAHKLRNLLDPSALFIVVDVAGNSQLVARSSTDDINVAEVAQRFGGGGHDHAAAALIRARSAEDICGELRDLLPECVQPRVKVRDVMSSGVRTIDLQETVESLDRQMRQTGHEGFPVVDASGEIVGLVTRNAVDRALQHRWDTQPIHRIMQPGAITVSPDDSVEKVRTLMIQRGWGQIPVVEGGKPIGVVTRTDLIRLPASTADREREQIAHRMEEAFPAPLLSLIRQMGVRSAQSGHVIYFVGGIVRDLLLGQSIVDVDVVVEGDAITLGQTLASSFGGEIRTHSRFGTVKWLLPDGIWAQMEQDPLPRPPSRNTLPAFIDLVTARTEFYEHPTALPMVSRSSIKQDLHRRDFTINTLAIRLDPQRWGEMLDFYNGKEDLDQGIIRVLHSLSFVDDPTRILRAARFETRLGFHLDPRSEALIGDALPLLARVSGARLRHELDLIFREARPEAALTRLQELGALVHICTGFSCDTWLSDQAARVRRQWQPEIWDMEEEDRPLILWALFLTPLDPEALAHAIDRLSLPRELSDIVEMLPQIKRTVGALSSTQSPSAIVAALDPYPLPGLAVAWCLTDGAAQRDLLMAYTTKWRHVAPALKGADLKALGFKPGPLFREVLQMVRAARLDGWIHTLEEEKALVLQRYGAESAGNGLSQGHGLDG